MCTIGTIRLDSNYLFKNRDPIRGTPLDEWIEQTVIGHLKMLVVRNNVGCYGGINNLGVGIVGTYVNIVENQNNYFDSNNLLAILSRGNLESVREYLEKNPDRYYGNLICGDPSKSYAFELNGNQTNCLPVTDKYVMTNHFQYIEKQIRTIGDAFVKNWTYTRLSRAKALLANVESFSDIVSLLSDHANSPEHSICNHGKVPTASSFIIDCNNCCIWFCQGPPCERLQKICLDLADKIQFHRGLMTNSFPTYTITDEILTLMVQIAARVDVWAIKSGMAQNPRLRRVRGDELVHIAPPADMVSGLIADLISWTRESAAHPLIKSCVFHYEFEVIHPFADGNGRMGRMWQTLLLYQWKEIFAWLPVETMVWERQQEYYAALGQSNDTSDCTQFVLFMLQTIWDTLEKFAETDQGSDYVTDQVKRLMDALGTCTLSAVELMESLGLKHRPTFRKNYLHPALEAGLIEMTLPKTPSARGQKYRRK